MWNKWLGSHIPDVVKNGDAIFGQSFPTASSHCVGVADLDIKKGRESQFNFWYQGNDFLSFDFNTSPGVQASVPGQQTSLKKVISLGDRTVLEDPSDRR